MKIVFKRLLKNKVAVIGLGIIVVEIFCALLAPALAPQDPFKQDLTKKILSPGREGHLLGTDELGRDILSRILYGARISMTVGLIVVMIGLSVGVFLGAISGYFTRLDRPIMMVIDVLLGFPLILLSLVIVAVLGPGLFNAMVAVGISSIPGFTRVTRGVILSIRERDFIKAARASGEKNLSILFVHILPNALGSIIVQATIRFATAILNVAALSFLGLGAQPPTSEWGTMISTSRSYLYVAPHLVMFPGLAIMSVVLAFNLFGDGLRDALDPKLSQP
jgi:peptide/nickel transport system permease protein